MAAEHPELISDDPRCEGSADVADVQTLREAAAEHGVLISSAQAAKVLGCTSGQMRVWTQRGKFTRIEGLGGVMVPLAEVEAYKRLRDSGELVQSKGRNGRTVPVAEMMRAS